jgi:hypothetical protein
MKKYQTRIVRHLNHNVDRYDSNENKIDINCLPWLLNRSFHVEIILSIDVDDKQIESHRMKQQHDR